MTDTGDFLRAFRDAMIDFGVRRLVTPTDVVGSWRGFVEQCEEGYADNIYEFENDLAVRNLIMRLLENEELRSYSQMAWVRDEIDQIDARYRSLLLEEEVRPGRSWWEARIPRLAGEELAQDFAAQYGIKVTVVR